MNNAQQNTSDKATIAKLVEFKKLQEKYNENRSRSFIEDWSIGKNKTLATGYPEINLERSDLVNIRTFCAHGTNAWTLFSACTFANGQLLPGNEIKLSGMFAASGESKAKGEKGKNSVSTVLLSRFEADLKTPMYYADVYGSKYSYDYQAVYKTLFKKYNKRSKSNDLKKEIENFFNTNMEEAYKKLSNMGLVILGDGIGQYSQNPFSGAGNTSDEVLYKRVNIRVVIVEEKDKNFVQELIESINPKLAKTIAFLTTEEIKEFEEKREKFEKNIEQHNVDVYLNLFTCDFIDTFSNKLPFTFSFNQVKKIENEEAFLHRESLSRRSYSKVLCEQTKSRAVKIAKPHKRLKKEEYEKEKLAMRELFQSANPELAETTVLLTSQEIKKQKHPIPNAISVKFKIRTEKIPVKYYIESSVDDLENLNSKKAILENLQKACEYYNKAIEYYDHDWPYSSDACCARKFQAEAVLSSFSSIDKEDADLVKSFNATHQLRINTEKERNRMLDRTKKTVENNNMYSYNLPPIYSGRSLHSVALSNQ
ncbi:hypothetical protein [Candidatus Mesenet endosymbiont of Agriotes lineatus]|uniref:hypothetical protein n=1 Tax=Candidatus Mesenet endosymbiont of Agriotes lineatus TaxID=3077948 RepID=UPI0030CB4802